MRKITSAALLLILMVNLSGCSDDKAVSVSPALSGISLSPSTLYTGQKATVSVTYSNLGEHVYYSSSHAFVCTIKGIDNNYVQTDSIYTFKTKDLRIPQDFSFDITMPLIAGSYTVTFKTPSINKSSTEGEGSTLYFNSLSASKNIKVTQSDAIDANFGDSREKVASYISVSDTTVSLSGFDAAAKASAITSSSGFTSQKMYYFVSDALAEVDEVITYNFTGIKYDEQGKITGVDISNDDASAIQKRVNSEFLPTSPWALVEGNIYEPTTAKDIYKNMATNDNTSDWLTFLKAMSEGEVKSYTYKHQHGTTGTIRTAILTVQNDKAIIIIKYTG